MGISQQIGSSSLSKPGVCTSSTRPATPYEGQMIYETDTDKVLVYNGSAWYANWNTAWGKQAFTTNITSSSAITSTATQITSASTTFISGRSYKISYFEPQMYIASGSPSWMAVSIKNGATTLNLAYISPSGTGTSDAMFLHTWVGELTGTTTITATASVGTSGSLYLGRGATQFAYLLIEDIGPT